MRKGYLLMADSVKALLERGEIEREEAERKIAVYSFLAECSEQQICDLFDSGVFNDIVINYVRHALDEGGASDTCSEKVLQKLKWFFDTVKSKDIIK